MFWLVKLKFVWYTEFMDVYTKPSRFPAAVFPAMAMAPKEFTEDWISTLEMEKMAPCMPAGKTDPGNVQEFILVDGQLVEIQAAACHPGPSGILRPCPRK